MNTKMLVELTRIEHGIMLGIAVIVGEIIALNGFNLLLWPTFFGFLTALFVQMGSFALGDVCDIEADRINKRTDRPLANNPAYRSEAIMLSIILFAGGLIAGAQINILCYNTAILFTALGVLYAVILKKIPLIGNMAIAASMAIPFIFGNLIVSNNIMPSIWIAVTFTFFAGVGRELIKSIEDVKGDTATGRKTLPIVAGIKVSEFAASIFVLLGIAITVYGFLEVPPFKLNYYYLILVSICDILYILGLLFMFEKRFRKARNITLIAPLFGLFALIASVLH